MAHKFEPGDRVICMADDDKNETVIGQHGTVIGYTDDYTDIVAVEWDRFVRGGHNLTNLPDEMWITSNRGWNVNEYNLVFEESEAPVFATVSHDALFNLLCGGEDATV